MLDTREFPIVQHTHSNSVHKNITTCLILSFRQAGSIQFSCKLGGKIALFARIRHVPFKGNTVTFYLYFILYLQDIIKYMKNIQ